MRRDLSLAITVTLGSLLLYGLTVCPTIYVGDSPELVAASACLGVAHPPGYPVYTLIGWLVLLLPLGSPALMMNLLSGLFGALACAATAWLVLRWSESTPAAAFAGAALAVSSTFWLVSVTTEVYSMHLLLIALLLCAATLLGDGRTRGARRAAFFGACVVLGVGLAHHPTIVVALPAALCLALRPDRRRDHADPPVAMGRRIVGWTVGLALVLVIPALFYAGLMLRARADPPSNWGRVTELPALFTHVSALTYRHLDMGWSGLFRADAWVQLGQFLTTEFSMLVFPLAVAGLLPWASGRFAAGFWRRRLATLVLIVSTVAFGLRYDVEDVVSFYLPAFLGLALAAGLGLAVLLRDDRSMVRRAGVTIGALLVVMTFWGNLPSRNLRNWTAAEEFARDVLDTVPPNGLLFVREMDSFGLLYLTQVLGERPDVSIYHRRGVVFGFLPDEVRIRPIPGESPREYVVRTEQAFIDTELQKSDPRPAMFLGWPGYDTPPRFRIEPVGLLHRIRPARDPFEDTAALWGEYAEDRVIAQAQSVQDPLALSIAGSYPIARGERAVFRGDASAAEKYFDEAVLVADESPGTLSYIGTVYGRYGDYPRAIRVLRRSVEVWPSSFLGWNNLAKAYELSGDHAAAREALERSLEILPGQEEVVRSLRRLNSPPR